MAIEGSGRLAWSAIDKGIAAEWESAHKTLQALLATELPLTMHIEVLIGPGAAPGKWVSAGRKEIKVEKLDAPAFIVDESHAGSNGFVDLASEVNVTEVTWAAQADPEPQANPQTPPLREAGDADLRDAMGKDERHLYARLDAGRDQWRKLGSTVRGQMIHALGHSMTLLLGRPVTMGDWVKLKPAWAPGPGAIPTTYGKPWHELQRDWAAELTPE